uniref:KIAA1614 n=1 Tax=Suricata suricatta TaxID=37032 RepID=A0A673V6F1_SURSU
MEGAPEAAAQPAGGGPQGTKIGSRPTSSVEMTSGVEKSGSEPQLDNGHLPRPWSFSLEARMPNLMAPQHPRAQGIQLQGPSVLESKVRALKEKMTAGKQGVSPCPASQERPWKKPKCRRVRVGGARTPSEGSSLPDAEAVLPAQNVTEAQLDSVVNKDEPARDGVPRPPRPPSPGLECWDRKSPWPPEAAWASPDKRSLLPGPGSLPESPIHRVTPGLPGGPCNKITHRPNLRKGRSYALQEGLVTGGDLDSLSLTSEEDVVPRGARRPGDLGALGTGGSALSLSDRVERNRLLLQEMLSVGGQGPPKVGLPVWTPSQDRGAPERPTGDVDWDSGISLQDSDQNRTFGPKPASVLSPKQEEAKHLLQRARMKARTRPLRASHDIVPAVAQGSRDGRRSPALDPRMTFACRDNLQNGNTSDSSSGESSSGQWPKRGPSPSRVRFEDESARDAESRYLERLQQRQHQARSCVLGTVAQGPLRSKPDVAHYIGGGGAAGGAALCRLAGSLDPGPVLAPPTARGAERKCRVCGSRIDDRRPAQGKASPDPRAFRERGCGAQGVQAEPLSPRGPSPLFRLFPAEQGLHAEWIRETHIGDSALPEEVDSALDSTDTSDSCRTDSEEAGTSQRRRARGPARGSSPHPRAARPLGGPRSFRKAESQLPESPQAPHCQPGVDHVEAADEVKEGRGQPEGTLVPREDAFPKPRIPESKRASLGSQWQPGPALGNHWLQPVDSTTLCRTACAPSLQLGSLAPGGQAQVIENHESLEAVSASSLRQCHGEPSALLQAQQPTSSVCPGGWVPTPPSSKKTTSPVPHRKAALARPSRLGEQGEPVDTPLPSSRSVVPRTCELSPSQTQPYSSQVGHPLLVMSTNNCNISMPPGLQEPRGGASRDGQAQADKGLCSQEPALENLLDGGHQGPLGSAAVGTVSSVGITLSLASEETESSQEPEGGLQRTELSSRGHVSTRASPGVSAGPGPPSATPSDRSKKSGSSLASTLGLKKLFLALGQGTRPKLGKARSYSVEQLRDPAPGLASHTSTPKVKRAPSLQSLHLVSPSHQHRKAVSFQNLHSLLRGKGDRSSLYVVGEPGDHSADGRPAKAPPQRALSVEDVSAPSQVRTVGRVVEVFPDGTTQLQLQCSPEGTFGFCVASGNGRRDSGGALLPPSDITQRSAGTRNMPGAGGSLP